MKRLASHPYTTGLALLGRRELTSTQLRDRLARKGFAPEAVNDTIQRLTEEGALDDRRTAGIYARQAALIKHRGPRRAILDIVALGLRRMLLVRLFLKHTKRLTHNWLLNGHSTGA
ncbi:MAG: hypothetical protein Ct9H300mP25_13020 [Acidobacteriota bacterium]|nr:MAG: hypothetical protein Ct9H300mP25_13020 [Acidobacteriota bacterium]